MTIWDVHLQRRLHHGASRFELDLRFASSAQRLVLFGPSGSGKTQTLRMLAGISRPDAGHVRLDGRTLYDSAVGLWLSPQARRLGYVFQDYALFPHLTVRQNVGFARRRGWRNPVPGLRDPQVERWLQRLHLDAVADHLPHQISGGQRQRTALARALVGEPSALLLDEPFAALDTGLRRRLRQELLELQTQLGIPLLMITHDDEDLAVLAQEVVQIDGGRRVPAASGLAPPDPV